ncbi:MAG TPA: hypothetical protein VKQ32_19440 [Polyangia bacterium]|nr:hypothetical protein [Polyangia bacterium]
MLDLEAHPLLVDPHLALDAGTTLGLLQPHVIVALPLLVRFLRHPSAVLLVADPLLFGLAGGAVGRFPRLAFRLGLGAGGLLLFLDAVVFDPSQLT